jgi:type I restriction enzyme S subunit
LLEQAARLLYKEWFVHLRFPGHEHVKIKDGVPEGWEKKKITDVCETIGGGTPSQNARSLRKDFVSRPRRWFLLRPF